MRFVAVASLVAAVYCLGFIAVSASEAAPELPPRWAARVEGLVGRAGSLPMGQFSLRRVQVRAERRGVGATNGLSVGEESLRQMLEEVDVEGEADRRGIKLSSRQVRLAFRRVKLHDFSSISEFREYLRRSHLSESEARHRVKVQLLFTKIEKDVTAGYSLPQRIAALRKFTSRYLRQWRSRTICRRALATDRCSNGPPLPSGSEVGRGVGPVQRGWSRSSHGPEGRGVGVGVRYGCYLRCPVCAECRGSRKT